MVTKEYLVVLVCFSLVLFACDKNKEGVDDLEISVPELGTIAPVDVTKNTARSGGVIYTYGNSIISTSGVVWDKAPDPDVQNSMGKTVNGSRIGSFYSLLKDLEPGTTYYVRSYATNAAGTAYGEVQQFTTLFEDVVDYDGNVYTPIVIGNQTWLKESLKVKHYRNGDPIPNVADNAEWTNLTAGAYAVYPDVPNYADEQGLLYNWFAVNDERNIAPEGWRVPTRDEVIELIQFVGGTDIGGHALKIAGDAYWWANADATNSSGFSAYASGFRQGASGEFVNHHANFYAWTYDAANDENGWCFGLSAGSGGVDLGNYTKKNGFSVRLIKE